MELDFSFKAVPVELVYIEVMTGSVL